MRLYHHPMSSSSRRAVMTALQLGTKIQLVLVDLAKGEQKKPAFLAMNPNGRVPVLDDDGFFLNESHAIMQYLADKTPGQTLYPLETRARADVNRWLFWSANHFAPAIAILSWENAIKGMIGAGPPDPVEVKKGEARVAEFARVLDAHLAGKSWVAQGQLTLADLALAAPLMSIVSAKLPVRDYANVMAWFERIQALDAWKKTSL
jgi:glutathione S-transferase